jgi:SIR2-like domain
VPAYDPEAGWERLAAVYREQPLALVLGAGVSEASGVPTWRALLATIARDACLDPEVVEWMLADGHSLPAIAAALEHACGSRAALVERLRAALYPPDAGSPADNATLQAVAAFCVVRAARRYAPNPGVAAIATTNIDTVLQDFVAERYGGAILRPVERASTPSALGGTPLYLLHGVLRRAGAGADEAPERVVLTEQDYFDVFDAPTSYLNYTTLHLLREHPCCFVGHSLTDENVRRLLHYSRKERVEALADAGRAREAHAPPRHFAILRRPQPAAVAALARLDVAALPIGSYDEIPDRLAWLYEARPARWTDVFP